MGNFLIVFITALVVSAMETFVMIKKFTKKSDFKKINKEFKNLQKELKNLDLKDKELSDEKIFQIQRDFEIRLNSIEEMLKKIPEMPNDNSVNPDFIKAIKKILGEKAEKTEVDSQKEDINNLKAIVKMLSDKLKNAEKDIDALKAENNCLKQQPKRPETPKENIEKKKTAISKAVKPVRLNREYIESLETSLEKVKPVLLTADYNGMKKTLDKIIQDDEYDDPEEIMCTLHNKIEKHIYRSFSKVKTEQKIYISRFLEEAGYALVEVTEGSDAKLNAQYFEEMFPINTDDINLKGKISKVDNQPYEIAYYDDNNTEKMILGGICAFYK